MSEVQTNPVPPAPNVVLTYITDRLSEDGTWAGMGVFLAAAAAALPIGAVRYALLAAAAGCGSVAAALKAKGA